MCSCYLQGIELDSKENRDKPIMSYSEGKKCTPKLKRHSFHDEASTALEISIQVAKNLSKGIEHKELCPGQLMSTLLAFELAN